MSPALIDTGLPIRAPPAMSCLVSDSLRSLCKILPQKEQHVSFIIYYLTYFGILFHPLTDCNPCPINLFSSFFLTVTLPPVSSPLYLCYSHYHVEFSVLSAVWKIEFKWLLRHPAEMVLITVS